MRVLSVTIVCLLTLVGPAAADDEKQADPKKAPPKVLTPRSAADAALAAVRAGDDKALETLAGKNRPDPWLVADELCHDGEFDAAAAFANAAPRANVKALPAYVESWRKRPPEEEARQRLALWNAAMRGGKPAGIVKDAASLPERLDTVVRIQLGHVLALAERKLRRFAACAAGCRATATAARSLGWADRQMRVLHMGAMAANEASDFTLAAEMWAECLPLLERHGAKTAVAYTLGNLGNMHNSLGNYPEALESYERSLAGMEALDDEEGAAWTLSNLGSVHHNLGDYTKALALYERARAAQVVLEDELGAATTLGYIGNVHYKRGDFAKALATYKRARASKAALGDNVGAASTLSNIGLVHYSRGDYMTALATYERALAAQEALRDKSSAITTLGNIGNVHFRLGNYAKALAMHQRSLAAAEALGDKLGVATALGGIGIIQDSLGDYPGALATYELALEAKEALRDKDGIARTLGNMAGVYGSLGDYAKALAMNERALAAKKALSDKAGAATTLSNIGSIHHRLGDHTRALKTLKRALAAQEALGAKASAAKTLGNIGMIQEKRGDLSGSLATHERALAAKEAVGDKAGAAATLTNIGLVERLRGNHAKALATLERARGMLGDTAKPGIQARTCWALAGVHLDQGNADEAAKWALKAVSYTTSISRGLAEGDGARAREVFAPLFDVTYRALRRADNPTGLALALEQGRAGSLRENLGSRSALEAAVLPERLRGELITARESEQRALRAYEQVRRRRNRQRNKEARAVWHAAQAEVARVSKDIERKHKRAAAITFSDPDDLGTIQSYLGPTDALIYYVLTSQEGLALVVRKKEARIVSLAASKDINAATAALLSGDEHIDPDKVPALRRLLVDPLGLAKDVRRVLVSPMGRLGYVPYALLFPAYEIANVPSGTTYGLLREDDNDRGARVLALGDPDYGRGTSGRRAGGVFNLARLPHSRTEAEAVGDVRLLGAEATEGRLHEALRSEGRWRAVHLACHGLIDPERPRLSALAVTPDTKSDGFLRALEIFRMRIPADLVVMSACETGKGKIYQTEGILGLTSAFMFAGAPRVLCSLWKVDDAATRALMVKFYELWNPKDGKGIGAAAALKQAQAFVRNHPDHDWEHPQYWAAWVLWGLPDGAGTR